MAAAAGERPGVSVVLPFHGSAADAAEVVKQLSLLRLRAGDELVVVDNTEDGVFADHARGRPVEAVDSPVKRSAYAARNVGAERARNDWLLFVDADCRLPPDLLDRYFEPPPPARAGALAGQIAGAADQPGFVPAYMRSRNHLNQEVLRDHLFRPMAVTANLLVRREAWESVGGFAEQTLSGADADFCWRLQDAGWTLDLRPAALVEHVHRSDLRALLVKSARDGAGGRWLSRRWPQFPAHPPLARELVRAPGGAVVWVLRGKLDRAAYKLVDLLFVAAAALGSMRTNATPSAPDAAPLGARIVFVREFPTVIAGGNVMVEAGRRADRGKWAGAREVPVRFAEDEGPLVQARALARLGLRRPLALVRARREHGWAELAAAAPAALRVARAAPRGAHVSAEAGAEEQAAAASLLAGVPLRR
jgi:GT2 family glycosyltransferase